MDRNSISFSFSTPRVITGPGVRHFFPNNISWRKIKFLKNNGLLESTLIFKKNILLESILVLKNKIGRVTYVLQVGVDLPTIEGLRYYVYIGSTHPIFRLESFFGVCVFCKLVFEVNCSESFGNLSDFGPPGCEFTNCF